MFNAENFKSSFKNGSIKMEVSDISGCKSLNQIIREQTEKSLKSFYEALLGSETSDAENSLYDSDSIDYDFSNDNDISEPEIDDSQAFIKIKFDKWDEKFNWKFTRLDAVKQFHKELTEEILADIQQEVVNANKDTTNNLVKFRVPQELPLECVAQIILSTKVFYRMEMESNTSVLVMYQEYNNVNCPRDYGIYRPLETEDDMLELYRLIYLLVPGIKKTQREEIKHLLTIMADEIKEETDPNLTAVGNGIWDFKYKIFLPYSYIASARHICFTKKIYTDYNPDATVEPHIDDEMYGEEGWRVEKWMSSFFEDDAETDEVLREDNKKMTKLLWEILHAFCRPNVNYNRAIWFGNPDGNGRNGKGTFLTLVRSILGRNACKTINLKGFEGRFAFQGITRWLAILGDENAYTKYCDDVSNYKCMVTGDPVSVDIKYGRPFDYIYKGMSIQCFNEYPRVADKSGSFARRLLIVNWTKPIDEEHENARIKDEYMDDKQVREYILYKILHMDVRKLSEPDAVKHAKSDYLGGKSYYIDEFAKKFMIRSDNADEADNVDKLVWNRMPIDFVYDLYAAWMHREHPTFDVMTNQKFKKTLPTSDIFKCQWEYQYGEIQNVWNQNDAQGHESLIEEYDLTTWKGCIDGSNTKEQPKAKYRGMIKRKDS